MPNRALLLVRSRVPGENTAKYARAAERFASVFEGVEGISGPTLYSAEHDPEIHLSLVSIEDLAAFELAAAEKISEEMATTFSKMMDGPPSVRLIRVRASQGRRAANMPADSYISISDRTADPGLEDDLAQDYHNVFLSFEAIPGFAGWAYGPDGTLEEHIYGLAIWETREALGMSLKPDTRHELRIYRKLREGELATGPVDFLGE